MVKDFVPSYSNDWRGGGGVEEICVTSFMDNPSGNKKNTMKIVYDKADLNKGLSINDVIF